MSGNYESILKYLLLLPRISEALVLLAGQTTRLSSEAISFTLG